jgi:hypothetical protein
VPRIRIPGTRTTLIDKIKNQIIMKENIARLLFRLSKAIEELALSLAEQEEYQPVIDDSEVYS